MLSFGISAATETFERILFTCLGSERTNASDAQMLQLTGDQISSRFAKDGRTSQQENRTNWCRENSLLTSFVCTSMAIHTLSLMIWLLTNFALGNCIRVIFCACLILPEGFVGSSAHFFLCKRSHVFACAFFVRIWTGEFLAIQLLLTFCTNHGCPLALNSRLHQNPKQC